MNDVINNDSANWKEIYNFILECGKSRDPKNFAMEILNNIDKLCEFDSGVVYLLDSVGNVCDQYLVNSDERWSKLYLGYYANADNKEYSLFEEKRIQEKTNEAIVRVHDWNGKYSSEFITDFIRPRGLRYTCGFGLYDIQGNMRITIALDRINGKNFSENEIQNLRLAAPQLNNLHKNFFYHDFTFKAVKQAKQETLLTPRESQVADLLCQSFSPANISRILHISRSTTYKHIANIYEKMNVSSQRELLSQLLNQPN